MSALLSICQNRERSIRSIARGAPIVVVIQSSGIEAYTTSAELLTPFLPIGVQVRDMSEDDFMADAFPVVVIPQQHVADTLARAQVHHHVAVTEWGDSGYYLVAFLRRTGDAPAPQPEKADDDGNDLFG